MNPLLVRCHSACLVLWAHYSGQYLCIYKQVPTQNLSIYISMRQKIQHMYTPNISIVCSILWSPDVQRRKSNNIRALNLLCPTLVDFQLMIPRTATRLLLWQTARWSPHAFIAFSRAVHEVSKRGNYTKTIVGQASVSLIWAYSSTFSGLDFPYPIILLQYMTASFLMGNGFFYSVLVLFQMGFYSGRNEQSEKNAWYWGAAFGNGVIYFRTPNRPISTSMRVYRPTHMQCRHTQTKEV